jgi:hypothetical protein
MKKLVVLAALAATAPGWTAPPAPEGAMRLLYGSSISGEIEPCG